MLLDCTELCKLHGLVLITRIMLYQYIHELGWALLHYHTGMYADYMKPALLLCSSHTGEHSLHMTDCRMHVMHSKCDPYCCKLYVVIWFK